MPENAHLIFFLIFIYVCECSVWYKSVCVGVHDCMCFCMWRLEVDIGVFVYYLLHLVVLKLQRPLTSRLAGQRALGIICLSIMSPAPISAR